MLRRRGKKGIIVAIAFASLALTSVGFSTWIASYQTITEVESNVTVGVEDVITGGLAIEASLVENETGFLFDAAKDDTEGPIVNSGGTYEDLTVAFNVRLLGENVEASFNGLSIIAEAADEKEEDRTQTTSLFNGYSASGENQYFTSPFILGEEKVILLKDKTKVPNDTSDPNLTHSISITDPTNISGGIEFTVQIQLGWGSYFGYINPSRLEDSTMVPNYFNGLRELKALNDRKIKFTVKHPGTPFTSFTLNNN